MVSLPSPPTTCLCSYVCSDFVISFITTDVSRFGSIDVDCVITFATINSGFIKLIITTGIDIDIIAVFATIDNAGCKCGIDIYNVSPFSAKNL